MVQRALYAFPTAMLPYAISRAAYGDFADDHTQRCRKSAGCSEYELRHALCRLVQHYNVRLRRMTAVFYAAGRRKYQRICKNWPRARVPEAFYTIAPSPVPVLLLSGGIDPVTPTAMAIRSRKRWGRKTLHISVQHAGHGMLMNACIRM
jgi:pimeloyl-ACP methyl ester carboxylesterase